jgi:hypothetical protein
MKLKMAELLAQAEKLDHPELTEEEIRRKVRERIDADPYLKRYEE